MGERLLPAGGIEHIRRRIPDANRHGDDQARLAVIAADDYLKPAAAVDGVLKILPVCNIDRMAFGNGRTVRRGKIQIDRIDLFTKERKPPGKFRRLLIPCGRQANGNGFQREILPLKGVDKGVPGALGGCAKILLCRGAGAAHDRVLVQEHR